MVRTLIAFCEAGWQAACPCSSCTGGAAEVLCCRRVLIYLLSQIVRKLNVFLLPYRLETERTCSCCWPSWHLLAVSRMLCSFAATAAKSTTGRRRRSRRRRRRRRRIPAASPLGGATAATPVEAHCPHRRPQGTSESPGGPTSTDRGKRNSSDPPATSPPPPTPATRLPT